ncbi:MAG: phage portal protein [Gammaproteobacteria bacterium]|nr:phage portal protein [Gammaproteobacteria bacterium]
MFDKIFSSRSTPHEAPRAGGSSFSFGLPIAGTQVDEDSAMMYSAFWACVKIISETIALLSWRVYEEQGRQRVIANDHGLDRVLRRRPNEEMTPFIFKEVLTSHCLSWGNGYAEIERYKFKPGNDVAALWPIYPDSVNIDRDSRGRLYYEVSIAGQSKTLRPDQMFHIRGPSPDGIEGWSVVRMAKESIALGLAAEEFGSAFFGNGAQLGGIIYDKDGTSNLDAAGKKNLLKKFNTKHRGARKSNKVEYLDKGLTYESLGIPPDQAQFLETRKFQLKEMCRWFRVPPHKLADLERSTHSNIESENISFVTDAILPWVSRWENEANFKLMSVEEHNFYTKMNINSLLRGDSQSRAKYYKTMSGLGAFSIDDILELEDRNPLPSGAGDLRMVPLNMVSVEKAHKEGTTSKQRNATAAQKGVFLDVATRLSRIEVKRLEQIKAKSGDAGVNAINQFYSEHAGKVRDSFVNPVKLLSESMGVSVNADSFVDNWIAESREKAIHAYHADRIPSLVQSWEVSRPIGMTENLITHIFKEGKSNAA